MVQSIYSSVRPAPTRPRAASACFFPCPSPPPPFSLSLARSLSWAVATPGRQSPPPTPGAQVFSGPFVGEEHHLVRPPLGLPFLLRETVHHPNPNLVFVFGSDLVTSAYACITATNFDCFAKEICIHVLYWVRPYFSLRRCSEIMLKYLAKWSSVDCTKWQIFVPLVVCAVRCMIGTILAIPLVESTSIGKV